MDTEKLFMPDAAEIENDRPQVTSRSPNAKIALEKASNVNMDCN